MSRKKPGRRSRRCFAPSHKAHVTIAVVLVTSLFAAWTVLAYSGALDSAFRQTNDKPKTTAPANDKPKTIAPANLNPDSPSKEYIYAGGRLVATEEAAGCAGGITASNNLTATASSNSAVSVVWTAFTGPVDHYEVERRTTDSFATVIFNVPPASPTVSVPDINLSGNTAYLYRVRAFDSATCPSGYTNEDLATTTIFTENVAFGVTIRASHINELFTAVNAVYGTAGLGSFNWPTPPGPPTFLGPIKKDHVQLLRDNLNLARGNLNLIAQPFTNNPLNIGDIVFAAHIQELRNGVK